MTQDEQGLKRKLFWERLRENARSIVEREKTDLEHQTVDPEYCLLESDKALMRDRRLQIDMFNDQAKSLKQDKFGSRCLALYTILLHQPSLLLKI
ncbi:MAG: hypothetical protein ACK4NR_04470 [Micavibrio sp.]